MEESTWLIKCGLPVCEEEVWLGKEYCCRKHCLEHLENRARDANVKICALPGCDQPVYVERERIHDYCGFRHAKHHAVLRGRQACAASSSPTPLPLELCDQEIVDGLKQWIETRKQEVMVVIEDFYDRHPWEVIPNSRSSTNAIVKLKWRSSNMKRRDNTTVDGCTWKQRGHPRPLECSPPSQKVHRTYSEPREGLIYTMVEYRMLQGQENKAWAAVRLKCHKESTSSKRRKRSSNGSTEEEAELNNENTADPSLTPSSSATDDLAKDFAELCDYLDI